MKWNVSNVMKTDGAREVIEYRFPVEPEAVTADPRLRFSEISVSGAIENRAGIVTVSYTHLSDGSAVSIDPADFDIYSFRGDGYADCVATPPYPAFGGTLLPGQSINGYIPYLVKESEQRPLLSIDANYDGAGDIWLALR